MFRRIKRALLGTPRPPARRPAPSTSAGTVPRPERPSGPPSPDVPRELVLYKYDACPYCRRVLSTIERLGVTVAMADTREDPAHRRALRDATGRTQVPCLFIDGTPLFESADIDAWLEDYAAQGGAPG